MKNSANKTVGKSDLPEKTCIVCLRQFSWRKKWQAVWADVKYCSEACRNGTPRMGKTK